MKSPLLYLTLTKLKNQLKQLAKSPAKLIYVLFLGAMLVLSRLGGTASSGDPHPLSQLTALLTLFYTGMFLLLVLGNHSGNSNMFTLSDATILFPSPLSPVRILFYGVVRQLGVSLLLGLVLLFQYGWLHDLFGITYGGLLLIVAGYALTLFFAQLCNMVSYARTSGSENGGKRVKQGIATAAVLYVCLAALACREPLLAMLSGSNATSSALEAAVDFFSTLPGLLFPITGWISGCVGGLLTGTGSQAALLLPLLILLLAILLVLLIRSKNNYYEDALQVAETAHSTVTAQKEGQMAEIVPKKVRLGKVGLHRGWGASVIFRKHMLENRRSGVFILSGTSLLFAVIILVVTVFLNAVEGDGDSNVGILAAFAMGTYTQLFSVMLGRFNRELNKPYLYLIPEPPLKKLLWAIGESMVSEAVEAVVIFVPVALITGAPPVDTALAILARITFSLLFTAGNVVVERVFGGLSSKPLIFLFYFLVLILMAVPGILLAVLLTIWELLPGFAGLFLGVMLGNIPTAVLALFLCRNMLQYAELNNR